MKALLLFLIFITTHCSIFAQDLSPYELKSVSGHKVLVVAIYEVSPEGLTFSPKPDKPLIGNTKLQKLNSEWINIDISSLQKYPELNKAYQSAIKGKEIELNIGPHFYDLSECHQRIHKSVPSVYYWAGGLRLSMKLDLLVQDHGKSRPKRWAMRSSSTKKTLTLWNEIHDSLKPISYRTDVMDYRNKIRRAIQGIESISSGEIAFDISAARKIDALYQAEL